VLVVDDETGIRSIARAILERAGFPVLEAADGAAALVVLQEHARAVAAVVLDVDMLRMNGEETLRELRGLRADLPVIVSSGCLGADVAERLRSQGAVTFLPKPYPVALLAEQVRQALGAAPPATSPAHP
jgi:DNA-binding NtrC family response regulator